MKAHARAVTAAMILALVSLRGGAAAAQVTGDAPAGKPVSIVDLRSREGLDLVSAEWRYRDASIVAVNFNAAGPDLKPSGPTNRTFDIEPKAGVAGFDDSTWQVIDPTTLEFRRSAGRLSFGWYRLNITIPERIGRWDPSGSTAILEVVVDDYAEIWVDGSLPVVLGQAGGALVKGWNVPNRVVLTRDAKPGQTFEVAIFGANGPLSNPPANYVWIRSATLDFHSSVPSRTGTPVATEILRNDAELDRIVTAGTKIEKLASGFEFIEGPVWVREGGYLLFSDPNANRIYRWTPDGEVSIYRTKSGYAGVDVGDYGQPGSNGLTLDSEGRLTVAEHGRRRVVRIERNGPVTVLADRWDGRRLNSPNDLVYRSDGTLYFTDPPFGLPRFFEDERKELSYSGVYRVRNGVVSLAANELEGPNGIAFSPDEKFLYVSNWDTSKKVIMRYEVAPDGVLSDGMVFFDMTAAPGEEALDGLKVDELGNIYSSGPGGLWIISPEGRHLGTIRGPELAANFAWGDDDGRTLYMTARTSLYRIRLNVAGIGPSRRPASAN